MRGGGLPEEQVPDEDRRGISVCRIGARHPAAHERLVHDVVVVERGEVGQLDAGRGGDHRLVPPGPELGCEQGEQRPEPLATRSDEVVRGRGDEGSSWSTTARSRASTAASRRPTGR